MLTGVVQVLATTDDASLAPAHARASSSTAGRRARAPAPGVVATAKSADTRASSSLLTDVMRLTVAANLVAMVVVKNHLDTVGKSHPDMAVKNPLATAVKNLRDTVVRNLQATVVRNPRDMAAKRNPTALVTCLEALKKSLRAMADVAMREMSMASADRKAGMEMRDMVEGIRV